MNVLFAFSSTIINKLSSTDMKSLDIGGTGCKIETTTLELKENFKCSGQELYNALTQKEMIQVFTGGDVKLEKAAKGESFEMIGGNVQVWPLTSFSVCIS